MKNRLFDKTLFVCFVLNLIAIIATISELVIAIGFPSKLFTFLHDPDNLRFVNFFTYLIFTPTLILWIYNLYFLFKNDRYSKSIFPLIFLSFFYSPLYYYKVKIRKRKLINKLETEPVLGRTIQLENYESDSDFESDLNKLKESAKD